MNFDNETCFFFFFNSIIYTLNSLFLYVCSNTKARIANYAAPHNLYIYREREVIMIVEIEERIESLCLQCLQNKAEDTSSIFQSI